MTSNSIRKGTWFDLAKTVLRIKQVLTNSCLSQADLARKANLTPQAISRIVRGEERPYTKRGQRIADALGWKGDWEELFEPVHLTINKPGVMPCIRCGDMPFSRTSESKGTKRYGFEHECADCGRIQTNLFLDEDSARAAWNALITGTRIGWTEDE